MKDICILVPQKALLSSIEDARHFFMMVNHFLKQTGKEPIFRVKLVGLTQVVQLERGMYSIRTDEQIPSTSHFDLIIIPSLNGDMISALALNIHFNPWLIQNYHKGAELASLCVGSFLLAATGLLKDNYCSTHWNYTNEFRAYFPGIKLIDDKIVTEHNGIYTSGGSTSYWNLLLRIV